MYAKKFYKKVAERFFEKNVKFYVHGRKLSDERNFYIHIYFGETLKIKELELHCFEILSYLVEKTRASVLMDYVE